MDHRFPPLLPKHDVHGPVVCVVAHPDDEIIGCGGMLAFHRARGDDVVVLHLTDGSGGDPDERHGPRASFREVRRREALAAVQVLGISDLRCAELPDGELPEYLAEATSWLRGQLEGLQPKAFYSFFFHEAHRDHRAVGEAVVASADLLPDDCRCLLFGVNHVVPGGTMFDISGETELKMRALAAYESQIAYNAFVPKVSSRDRGNTVNIDDDRVAAVEVFADLVPSKLSAARDRCLSFHDLVLGLD